MAYVPCSPPSTRDRLQGRRCAESRTLDSSTEGGCLSSRRVPRTTGPGGWASPDRLELSLGNCEGGLPSGAIGGGGQWMPGDSLSLGGVPVKSRSQIGHRDPNTREPQQGRNVLRGLQHAGGTRCPTVA